MSILAPDGRVDTAPTPTICEARWAGIGRCTEPAAFRVGVIKSCDCPDKSGVCCEHHIEKAFVQDGRVYCTRCNAPAVLTEPVRLRGAASDGRTE